MNSINLKVCGMKYQDNIKEVASLQPNYLGFIFYDKSARFFDTEIPKLPKNIKKVGVFVNASLNYILEKIEDHNLNCIQLHGNETPHFCKELKALCAIELIKVFSIKDEFHFDALLPFEKVCDYYLFDTKGSLPGGNGYAFDWTILKKYPSTKPYFLSGGIGLNEIPILKDFLNNEESKYCYAIDVNSKFEKQPGLKNITLLNRFKNNIITKI